MVKNIIGYCVVFTGKPNERRDSVRLSVEAGIASLGQWLEGKKVLIKGSAYQNWEVVAIEKITGSPLDVARALKDGLTVLDEDELKNRLEGMKNKPYLPQGGSPLQLP